MLDSYRKIIILCLLVLCPYIVFAQNISLEESPDTVINQISFDDDLKQISGNVLHDEPGNILLYRFYSQNGNLQSIFIGSIPWDIGGFTLNYYHIDDITINNIYSNFNIDFYFKFVFEYDGHNSIDGPSRYSTLSSNSVSPTEITQNTLNFGGALSGITYQEDNSNYILNFESFPLWAGYYHDYLGNIDLTLGYTDNSGIYQKHNLCSVNTASTNGLPRLDFNLSEYCVSGSINNIFNQSLIDSIIPKEDGNLFDFFLERSTSGRRLSGKYSIPGPVTSIVDEIDIDDGPSLPNPNTTPAVTLGFPGWEFMSPQDRLKSIPNTNGQYHPVLKSEDVITRTPDNAPVYLVVENTNTSLPINQRFRVLDIFAGQSSGFTINFLTAENINQSTIPTNAYLDPGQTYAVFLSAGFVQGTEPIALQQTRIVLPPVPSSVSDQNNIVSNIVATPRQQGDKRYYQITGTIIVPADVPPPPGTNLNFVIRAPESTSGQVLATVPYVSGLLPPIPTNQDLADFVSLVPGDYELSINSSVNNQEIQNPLPLQPMTANPSGANQPVVNSTWEFTTQQIALLNGGIVPDCGYDLGPDGNGRICGFNDLIGLIQQVIEYIFILTIPITAIVFAYAGFLYITSGENPKKREDAKNAMIKVVVGIAVVMSAWLIVTLIVRTLGASSATTRFLDL